MSRTKGSAPRLVLYGPDTKHKAKRKAGFKSYKWYIRHDHLGRRIEKTTGYGIGQEVDAHRALLDYVMALSTPVGTDKDPLLLEVLTGYKLRRAPKLKSAKAEIRSCDNLIGVSTGIRVSQVNKSWCQAFADQRRKLHKHSDSYIRRELGVLTRALSLAADEGRIDAAPKIWKPADGDPRSAFLTAPQVARIVRYFRSREDGFRGLLFVLLGVYTGHRKEAILTLRWEPHDEGGFVDLQSGMIDFRQRRATKKRRAQMMIPKRLLPLLHRAKRESRAGWVIEFNGKGVKTIKSLLDSSVLESGVKWHPHMLAHTCASWMIMGGIDILRVARHCGKSVKMIDQVYGHLMPMDGLRPNINMRRRWL